MARPVINGAEVTGMVRHWLTTPPNGYLGSDYGSEVAALLQAPMSSGIGDSIINKLKTDVPITSTGAVNLYLQDSGNDKKKLLLEVAESLIEVPST